MLVETVPCPEWIPGMESALPVVFMRARIAFTAHRPLLLSDYSRLIDRISFVLSGGAGRSHNNNNNI